MSKQIKQKNGIKDHFARKQTIDLMVILIIFIFVFNTDRRRTCSFVLPNRCYI